ncbi:hypothetical protein QAD02_019969 [Eretmocerus hayati]|uniref:Uncharacterized protein n=1 Tax=Eretmocerus hayati TaxID=131215 RepID=A0ACC2PPA8_9HYME|nr:hypothetical protein QAD02_019969 [Eretmocerus hayati]
MIEEDFTPPKAPKDLCFHETEFVQESFDTDHFLQEHRKNVSLEKMRDDLGIYLKILRSAMIELINKDYADFVNLSSNLIGLDKAISNLETPLGQLKEEVLQVRQCLDDAIGEMENNLQKHVQIREKKQSVHSLIRFKKSLAKLSSILGPSDSPQIIYKPEVLERAATEFNQLHFHTNRCISHLSNTQINTMGELDDHLLDSLNTLLAKYINEKQTASLTRCLKIYVSLEKIKDAEDLVRRKIVVPVVENIISEYSFNEDPLGLVGIYQKLEIILDDTLKELLEITLNPNRTSVRGFNFLVNSYWPEVEQRIEDYLPIIFAPGNPELFHKRYTESLDFLMKLENRCSTPDSLNRLKSHPQYERFLQKWNLPVYYQIRFQEIAGTAESILASNVSSLSIRRNKTSMNVDEFTLHASCIVWDCLMRVWSKDVYLPPLLHRFWKLCLQLCSRYLGWCKTSLKQAWTVTTINETGPGLNSENLHRFEFLVGLHTDVEKLSRRMSTFIDFIGKPASNFSPSIVSLMNDCAEETAKNLSSCLPLVTDEIAKELLNHSVVHLKQISDIPRLFRRTNRDIPTKPCAYVKRALDFLITVHADYNSIIPQTVRQWLILTLTSLTHQYLISVKDVLTSVQRTEESLRRLKKIRDKSAGVPVSESQGTSDDEKIRIQLLIDVMNYIKMIKDLGITEDDVEYVKDLLSTVEAATKYRVEV